MGKVKMTVSIALFLSLSLIFHYGTKMSVKTMRTYGEATHVMGYDWGNIVFYINLN